MGNGWMDCVDRNEQKQTKWMELCEQVRSLNMDELGEETNVKCCEKALLLNFNGLLV